MRPGLPGPSAPLSKVEEEEASQEGGPEAEAGSHPGRGVAAVVHRSGPCWERREREKDSVRASAERCENTSRTHLPVVPAGPLHIPPRSCLGCCVHPWKGGGFVHHLESIVSAEEEVRRFAKSLRNT